MNRLSSKERAAIIRALVEGNSLRSTTRITGRSINTVTKLLVDLGRVCTEYQMATLVDLPASRIECDEIWAFCYSKEERNIPEQHVGQWGFGDVWTWVALDPDTKLVCSWLIGRRDGPSAMDFLLDLGPRLRNRVQVTTDGHKPYLEAVEAAFGKDVDHAMLITFYGIDPNEGRFSPPKVLDEEVRVIQGNPDPDRISTSYVERNNLSMRMGMRRFTRLTNGFSKKVENHAAAVALNFMYTTFARPMNVLADPYPRTPAMAAGISDHVWTCEEIAALLD